jgi:hypothetical protein
MIWILMMQLFKNPVILMASVVVVGTISNLMITTQAIAGTNKLRMAEPVAVQSLPNENPTCYIQLPGQSKQTLDRICGTNDPKPERKRDRNELDRDGIPFVLKENFRAMQEAQRKLMEAAAKMERELPVSDNVLRLKAEQKKLSEQYMNAKTQEERNSLQKQLEQNNRQQQADPTLQKSYEAMRKLYQSNRGFNF